MPPKQTKGKGPVQQPRFAFYKRDDIPKPVPLKPFVRQSYFKLLRGSAGLNSAAALVSQSGLFAVHNIQWKDATDKIESCSGAALCPLKQSPDPILFVDSLGKECDLCQEKVVDIQTNGLNCALVTTARCGVVIVGGLEGVDTEEVIETRKRAQLISARLGTPAVLNPEKSKVISAGVGANHLLLCVLDTDTGCTQIIGRGLYTKGALGRKEPSKARQTVLEDPFFALHEVEVLAGEAVTKVWAGPHVSFAKGRRGLFAFGTVTPELWWGEPTLVLPAGAGTDVVDVAVTNSRVVVVVNEGSKVVELTPAGFEDISSSVFPVSDDIQGKKVWRFAAGKEHFVAMMASGSVYGMGNGAFGQLGQQGKGTNATVPVKLHSQGECGNVACGPFFTAFLLDQAIAVLGTVE